METVDHITHRVTSGFGCGLAIGSCFATFQGLPILPTTISMASSFALASTACFIPERIFYHSSFYLLPKQQISDEISSLDREQLRLYASHGLGGICGGSISGFLYKRKPFSGVLLFTPLMIGVAFCERKLQNYKVNRIRELQLEQDQRK